MCTWNKMISLQEPSTRKLTKQEVDAVNWFCDHTNYKIVQSTAVAEVQKSELIKNCIMKGIIDAKYQCIDSDYGGTEYLYYLVNTKHIKLKRKIPKSLQNINAQNSADYKYVWGQDIFVSTSNFLSVIKQCFEKHVSSQKIPTTDQHPQDLSCNAHKQTSADRGSESAAHSTSEDISDKQTNVNDFPFLDDKQCADNIPAECMSSGDEEISSQQSSDLAVHSATEDDSGEDEGSSSETGEEDSGDDENVKTRAPKKSSKYSPSFRLPTLEEQEILASTSPNKCTPNLLPIAQPKQGCGSTTIQGARVKARAGVVFPGNGSKGCEQQKLPAAAKPPKTAPQWQQLMKAELEQFDKEHPMLFTDFIVVDPTKPKNEQKRKRSRRQCAMGIACRARTTGRVKGKKRDSGTMWCTTCRVSLHVDCFPTYHACLKKFSFGQF